MKMVCVLCALCTFAVKSPGLDREAFAFTRYDLEVRVEPEQQRLGVRGKIVLRNDSDIPQRNVSLQISSTLNWRSIQFEGKPAEFFSQTYTSDIDHTGALTEAIVTLPRPVGAKQSQELEIGYEGVVPQDATRLTRIGVPADTARRSDWDQIGRDFTALRGAGYVIWYPVAMEAASLSEGDSVFEAVGRWKQREAGAGMHLAFSYQGESSTGPARFLCNGTGRERASSEISGPDFAEAECSINSLATVIPVFAIGSYEEKEHPAARIFYLRGHTSAAANYAQALEETAPLVSKWFGDHRERPEPKGEVVDLPDPDASPFESGNLLLMPLAGNDTSLLLSAARQVASQDFPSPRRWISSGLAGYAQAALIQERKGRAAALVYLQSHRGPVMEAKGRSPGREAAANSLINSQDEFFVETKAMNVWWMLRDMAGEQALTAALHNYKAKEDKDAYYMEKVIEAQAHRDLGWFFEDWVYRDRGLPDFRIASVYSREMVNGGFMVTVTVENLGAAAAEVPVVLRMAGGEKSEKLVVAGKSKASVRILAASAPREALVNDGSVPESDTSNNAFKIETTNSGP